MEAKDASQLLLHLGCGSSREVGDTLVEGRQPEFVITPTKAPADQSLQNLQENPSPASPIRVSEKARKLLRPKSAARPLGLLLRITKRQQDAKDLQQEVEVPSPTDISDVVAEAIDLPNAEEKFDIEATGSSAATQVAMVNAVRTETMRQDRGVPDLPVSLADKCSATQPEVENQCARQGCLGNGQGTALSVNKGYASSLRLVMTDKVGKENQCAPNTNQHLASHAAAKVALGFPKKPSRPHSRAPLGVVDMNVCGLRV
jgi:hypothetical protein